MEQTEASAYRGLELLKEGKAIAIVPQGCSMQPFIKGGEDIVRLMKLEKVEVGDIVLVNYYGKYLLHRVYAVDGEWVTTMGDGNLKGVERFRKEEALGTVVEIVHKGRRRKPSKGWLWRKLLPVRWLPLKVYRKWNKWRNSLKNKQQKDNKI